MQLFKFLYEIVEEGKGMYNKGKGKVKVCNKSKEKTVNCRSYTRCRDVEILELWHSQAC